MKDGVTVKVRTKDTWIASRDQYGGDSSVEQLYLPQLYQILLQLFLPLNLQTNG